MTKAKQQRHLNTVEAIERRGLDKHDVPVANVNATRNDYGLTEKQEIFAQCVAKGATLSDAYRAAYNAEGMTNNSINSNASALMDHTAVAARVKHLLQVRQEKSFALDAMRIRAHVFDRLMIESVDDENPAAARIRSLELLGKIDVVSMFKEQKGPAPDDTSDPAELEAKLRGALAKLLGDAKVIGGS